VSFSNEVITCIGSGTYTYTFDLTDLTGCSATLGAVASIVNPSWALNPFPYDVQFASLQTIVQNNSVTINATGTSITISGGFMSLDGSSCCDFAHTITLPPCPGPAPRPKPTIQVKTKKVRKNRN
jgi:hypothetical protein